MNSKLDREKHGARLDPLTGAANRKSFDERFAKDIDRRSLSEAPVTMLLWDIDNFKVINDSYGHRAGDRVLQRVAGCFKAAVRITASCGLTELRQKDAAAAAFDRADAALYRAKHGGKNLCVAA